VGRVLSHHDTQVASAEDQHPVGDLRPGGEHEPLRKGVRPRAPGRDLHGLDACAAQGRVERISELPGTVADHEVRSAVTGVHQEVADLLGSPRAVRVSGDPGDMHVAGTGLDHEQHVQALEGHRAVHMEEVGCQHSRGLAVQELPPCPVGLPLRRRRNPQFPQHPADGGGPDPVAELEQLALDPLISPALVLGGEPLDQPGDLGTGWRAPRVVRAGPLLCHQAAVPAQDSAGRDQPVRPQLPWQEPDEHGEDRATGPVHAGPGMGAAQHGNLVPHHQQLDVLGRR
jgi:hypothetical protein